MSQLPFLLQPSSRQIWMQAIARLLYQTGYGSIQFYIPLIFVNAIGLSATSVGIAVGGGALAGIIGHFLGGYLADSPHYGRKRALLFSAGLATLAATILALTQSFSLLLIANLLMGLSAGCYWTAADAAVVDVTPAEQRQKAFAILVLADSIGGGLGVLGGGKWLAFSHQSQMLFGVAGLVLIGFLGFILVAIAEGRQAHSEHDDPLLGFVSAFRDRSLQLFVLVNVLFTTYIAVVNVSLPLYFTHLIANLPTNLPGANAAGGANHEGSLEQIANLFTWGYIGFGVLIQVPIVQVLNAVSKVRVLMLSMGLWGVGFCLVWLAGVVSTMTVFWMLAAFSVLSIATAIYKPFAPAIVAELAPESLRGVYLAVSYQCWSIGYFVGPILGGWVLDQSPTIAHRAWIGALITTVLGLVILSVLGQRPASEEAAMLTDKPASIPDP